MLVGTVSSNTRDIFASYALSPSFINSLDHVTTTQQNIYNRFKVAEQVYSYQYYAINVYW